jgi:hypothetical protein
MDLGKIKIIESYRDKMPHPDNRAAWRVRMEIDVDGNTRTISHVFPEECFQYRSAEYGIDLDDLETLMDVILHENLITAEDMEAHPQTVYDESSVEETRKAHLSRCARVKLRHRSSTRPNKSTMRARAANPDDPTTVEQAEADHPLDPIRSHYQETPLCRDKLAECHRNVQQVQRQMNLRLP